MGKENERSSLLKTEFGSLALICTEGRQSIVVFKIVHQESNVSILEIVYRYHLG